MEFTSEKKRKLAKWIIAVVAACIVIFLGLQNLNEVRSAADWFLGLISPLVLGLAFALILNVPMSFLEKHFWQKTKKKVLIKLRRPAAFIVSLVIILGILAGVVVLVIPELSEALIVIGQGAINYINKLGSMSSEELSELPFGSILLDIDWDKLLASLQSWLKNQGGNIVNTAVGTVSSLVGGIYDFFISFIFAIYILFDKDNLKKQCARLIRVWIPHRFGEWFIHATDVLGKNFKNFITGQSLEAVILGVLCMLGMFIFQFPYAPMVGALVGVTALIPVVGAFIGAAVGAFMILTVDPMKAVFFILYIIILQQVEGNIIYPKVMGSRVELPAMWILAAVTVGGSVAGPVGMLLAVPIVSTIYVLGGEATDKREKKLLEKKKAEESTAEEEKA